MAGTGAAGRASGTAAVVAWSVLSVLSVLSVERGEEGATEKGATGTGEEEKVANTAAAGAGMVSRTLEAVPLANGWIQYWDPTRQACYYHHPETDRTEWAAATEERVAGDKG